MVAEIRLSQVDSCRDGALGVGGGFEVTPPALFADNLYQHPHGANAQEQSARAGKGCSWMASHEANQNGAREFAI